MKKFLILLTFSMFFSCGSDGWQKASYSQVLGCFKNGDDLIKITDKTLQFNDGAVMDLKRSSDDYDYFINAYFNGVELVAASFHYNPTSKQFKWRRFESGIQESVLTKIDCP
tara:strand:+ start:79 stop:414 length:336 start_codon:yes stop_codon:yes gene_type:complete